VKTPTLWYAIRGIMENISILVGGLVPCVHPTVLFLDKPLMQARPMSQNVINPRDGAFMKKAVRENGQILVTIQNKTNVPFGTFV